VSASFTFDNLIVQPDEKTLGKILKWDPDNPSKSDTTLGYTISSAQKKKCRVVISIYNLNGGLVYQRILDDNERQLCPGNYTFTWDGTNNQLFPPTPNYAPKGLYTFDIKVEGVCPYDTDHIRSDALSISQVKVLKPEAGTNTYELKYVLSDTKQASQAGVIVFDPNLEKKADAPGDTKNTPPGAQEPVWNEIKSISADIADITGDYSFVFWGIDDHPEIDKAHRKRPTLEMLANDPLGASANFGTSSPDVIATTLQAIDDAGDEQEAVYLQVEVLGQGNATKYDVRRQGKYTDWKWWNGSDFQKERKVKIGATAQEVIKGLKRVDVFSWLTHAIEDGRIALWDGDTFIAADHSTDDWFQSKFGSNFQDRVVYISDLSSFFKPPLSKLKCAFIINCSSDRPLSTVMAETIKEKGAQFVGTLVGGTVREIVALKFIDWFWHYATKGAIKEIKDGSNPNTVRRRWEMCSLAEAMELAWKEINKNKFIRDLLYGSRLEPKPLGNAYLGRSPLRAWSDEELKQVPLP
jgi:flagellar hook assembly protein FlgD